MTLLTARDINTALREAESRGRNLYVIMDGTGWLRVFRAVRQMGVVKVLCGIGTAEWRKVASNATFDER